MDIREQKKALRQSAKSFRNKLTKDDISVFSQKIHTQLFHFTLFEQSDVILLYASLAGEVETLTFIQLLLKNGKKVYCPVTRGETMEFYRVFSPEELTEGDFHVLEPNATPGNIFIPEKHTKFCIILPGLMFDKKGNRLGYGKGFYDKYLSALPEGLQFTKIALSFDSMVKDTIPSEETDHRADYIITEHKIYHCADDVMTL